MVLLFNGTVLAAGGVDNNGARLASSKVYNPATKTWAATIGPMTTPRAQLQMVLLSDGMVLAAGGADNNGVLASSEVYKPTTKTWAATTAPMTTRRYFFQMLLLLE